MKRPNSEEDSTQPLLQKSTTGATKRRYLHVREPGAILVTASPQDPAIVDALLSKAISIVLHGNGFESVKKDALESFRGVIESYLLHLSLRIKQSMQSSRRTQPIPQDFANALAKFNIEPSSLTPELNLPHIPSLLTQPPLFPAPSSSSTAPEFKALLPIDASDFTGKRQSPYVPKHFPVFPGKHTYKDTPVVTEREKDARRLRELASSEGMLAESALRKLVAAKQKGLQKSSAGARGRLLSKREKENDDAWRETMKSLIQHGSEKVAESGPARNDAMMLDGPADERPSSIVEEPDIDSEYNTIVNYDRAHWRSSARKEALGAV